VYALNVGNSEGTTSRVPADSDSPRIRGVSERVLTRGELNRATLARQLLLKRERLSVPRAVERLCALQAQYSPAPYVGLWSRLEGFRRADLERALARRQVVKASLFRVTLHIVSARDYPAFAAVVVGPRRAKMAARAPQIDLEAFEQQLRSEETWTIPRVRELVWPTIEAACKGWMDAWSSTRALFPLVHVPPSGSWRFHGEAQLMHAERWLGRTLQFRAGTVPGESAAAHLVRRYLAASGPASQADLLKFGGLQVRDVKEGLEAVELVRFRDEAGRVLLDLPRRPLPPAETRPPARFLTKWDSATIPYADRTRIVARELQREIIKKNGDFLQTVLVDGFVAGTWEVKRAQDKATLVVRPFEALPRAWRDELRGEGERLVRFVEDDATTFAVRIERP
jgi:hypothetical protein